MAWVTFESTHVGYVDLWRKLKTSKNGHQGSKTKFKTSISGWTPPISGIFLVPIFSTTVILTYQAIKKLPYFTIMEKIENMSSSYIYGVWDFLIFSMMVEYGNFFIALYFRVTIEEKNGPKKNPEMG